MSDVDRREAEQALSRRQERHWLGTVLLKVALLFFFSLAMVWFGGFGWLFAVALAGWLLFWPR